MQSETEITKDHQVYRQEGPYTGVRRDHQTPSPRTELAEYRLEVHGPIFPGTDRDLFFNAVMRGAYLIFCRIHFRRRVVHKSEEECLRETYSDQERAEGLVLLVCAKGASGHSGAGRKEKD